MTSGGPALLLLLVLLLVVAGAPLQGCAHQHLGSACVSASSAGGLTTVAPHRSKLALESADIAVIVIYFITVVAVGIWVRPVRYKQNNKIKLTAARSSSEQRLVAWAGAGKGRGR